MSKEFIKTYFVILKYHDAVIVTKNESHYKRDAWVRVENWLTLI